MNSRQVYSLNGSERVFVPRIDIGTEIDALPVFSTEPRYDAKGQIIRGPELGLYITDERTGRDYTGFIKLLNEREVTRFQDNLISQPYHLIVRNLKPGKGITYLEQRVRNGDLVHVKATNTTKNGERIFGKFLSYIAFMEDNRQKEIRVNMGDCLFGRVMGLQKDKDTFRLLPISIISEKRFEKYKNIVISSEDY